MEIFDVVDEHDKVIGQASRDECHADPSLIHHTCQFTLIDRKKKKVLLTQRAFTKEYDAGKVCFLGEHMLAGESYKDGVKRGIKEELGFDSKGKIEEVAHHIFRYDKQTEFVRFFLVEWMGEKVDFDKHEMEKVYWVDSSKLKDSGVNYSAMTKYWVDNIELNIL